MSIVDLDFTDVETSGGFLAPGTYRARVDAAEVKDGRNYPGIALTFASIEADTEGAKANTFVSLAPQALWKVYLTLEALGVPVAKEKLRLDTNKLVGRRALVKVINDPWTDAEGKSHDSSKVDGIFPIPKSNGDSAAPADDAIAPEAPYNGDPGPEPVDEDDIPF